ncbi:hypothetical protein [Pengzhenrongella sp.]|uniref:hypothetical protein n=1 Tax=Pengzhenrongella sp. TaxID=2888820 RepID=UPI002F9534B6
MITGQPHEGPNVFELGGWFWMIVDEWHGQRVYHSDDLDTWERAGLLLDSPGTRGFDATFGHPRPRTAPSKRADVRPERPVRPRPPPLLIARAG